jgi:hypothetical protein
MKKKILLFIFFFFSIECFSFGQTSTKEYYILIKKADSLYKAKEYKNSAFAFSDAFKANGWKGTSGDRYNAACSWSLANYPDSAFFNLERITTKLNYKDYDHITTDPDLYALHDDKRWVPLINLVKQNKDKAEVNLNKPLSLQLDSIFEDDQKYRLQIDSITKIYGSKSKEANALWKTIIKKDSVNLIKVTSILDKYGWLGADVIGRKGNSTLFLVIQHSNLKTQEKYKPMMEEAVKKGNAAASSYALLVDRVEMSNGRPQIYGSQVRGNIVDGYKVYPIIDEINVNKRRAEVGLQPLEEYLKYFNIAYELPKK